MCEENFTTIIECMIKKIKSELVPAGTIIIRPTTIIPEGFFECNGAEVSRKDYSELFKVVGTTYGSGDGVETFNLPDLRGEFVRGWDNSRGIDNNRSIGTDQSDAIRNITGQFGITDMEGLNGYLFPTNTDVIDGAFYAKTISAKTGLDASGQKTVDSIPAFDASRVVPTAEENRPRNIAMMYCIKY